MNKFSSPQDAINACNNECSLTWEEYCISHNIFREVNPQAYDLAKTVFMSGFMSGAKFVSDYIVNNIPKKQNETGSIPPSK